MKDDFSKNSMNLKLLFKWKSFCLNLKWLCSSKIFISFDTSTTIRLILSSWIKRRKFLVIFIESWKNSKKIRLSWWYDLKNYEDFNHKIINSNFRNHYSNARLSVNLDLTQFQNTTHQWNYFSKKKRYLFHFEDDRYHNRFEKIAR